MLDTDIPSFGRSARAAVIDDQGRWKGHCVQPIQTHHPSPTIYEQSSEDIWTKISQAVRTAVSLAGVAPHDIKGIGFDATCSLVVLDQSSSPQSVDQASGFTDHPWNVILWADHRAIDQADRINKTHHSVLQYVGGTISPEMQIPKTLWLKENLPRERWDAIGHLMDLPDYLTWRATNHLARSTCSLTCKFSHLPRGVSTTEGGWDRGYFDLIGLGCLVDEDWKRLGGRPGYEDDVLHAGDCVGNGLTEQAAMDLGLLPGTPVGSAVIDAYAGAVATLGASATKLDHNAMSNRLAIICGTSSCHIAMSPQPLFVPGVWGPYHSVLLPNMWCAEGGQSSTGQLIDYTLKSHTAYQEALELATKKNITIYTFLDDHLTTLKQNQGLAAIDFLTEKLHIYPDFHGNRSPLADPTLRGAIVGLTLDHGIDDLALRYLATLQSIACQTRHIVDIMNQHGYTIDTLCLSGGLCKNKVFVQLHADVTQCKVILPEEIEGAVVIGAAILGAKAAAGDTPLWQVMRQLTRAGEEVLPRTDPAIQTLYDKRYRVFGELLKDQKKYVDIMAP
jgi:FGGY-family pentulose kinase